VATAAAIAMLGAQAAPAQEPVRTACAELSPIALPCVGLQKVVDGVTIPLGDPTADAARDAYLASWVHRAVAAQYALQDDVPFSRAQWVGTHNSFNSLAEGLTLSHADSNQRLTLAQQLDIDVRSIELDLHFIPSVWAGGATVPVVCHGRGPDEAHFGCTTERPLTQVLPEIRTWLRAHSDQVVLLYLEDELGDPAGYAQSVAALDAGLRRADGTSMILRPAAGTGSCRSLPLSLTRRAVRAAGAQVVLVGKCVAGWSSLVHGWDDVHVESGSTSAYAPFPACDATYPRSVYDTKLVRYFEDSTLIATVVDPTQPATQPDRLNVAKTAAMAGCGVNLFGFDQLTSTDGRLEATVWSWAPGQPNAADGACTAMRADGRWERRTCTTLLRAACRTATGWTLSAAAVPQTAAAGACGTTGGTFSLPRDGYENNRLHQAAGTSAAWLPSP
jgi:hypothetical protein